MSRTTGFFGKPPPEMMQTPHAANGALLGRRNRLFLKSRLAEYVASILTPLPYRTAGGSGTRAFVLLDRSMIDISAVSILPSHHRHRIHIR